MGVEKPFLTAEQGRALFSAPSGSQLREVRNSAILAILLGCGLRRAELAALRIEELQLREDHWVVADLIGKGGHMRTVPVPDWVKLIYASPLGACRFFDELILIGPSPCYISDGDYVGGFTKADIDGLLDFLVQRHLANSSLVMMKATGHCPHLSAPDETIAAIAHQLAARSRAGTQPA